MRCGPLVSVDIAPETRLFDSEGESWLTKQKTLAKSEEKQDGEVVKPVLLGRGQAEDYQYPGAEECQEKDWVAAIRMR